MHGEVTCEVTLQGVHLDGGNVEGFHSSVSRFMQHGPAVPRQFCTSDAGMTHAIGAPLIVGD
jgi:hypothetical protein